jgi:hypothetical protein
MSIRFASSEPSTSRPCSTDESVADDPALPPGVARCSLGLQSFEGAHPWKATCLPARLLRSSEEE